MAPFNRLRYSLPYFWQALHQCFKIRRRKTVKLSRNCRPDGCVSWGTGEKCHFTEIVTALEHTYPSLAFASADENIQLAPADRVQLVPRITLPDDHFIRRIPFEHEPVGHRAQGFPLEIGKERDSAKSFRFDPDA